jgi:type IV secretory pathway TraG/TraD family ATPase VirD4
VLGTLSGMTLRSDEPAHVLVVGPSRSGKGTGFVLPNGYLWEGSAVFFDPKRENFDALANHRAAMGNMVFMFSPGSNDTHRYNPLDFVRRDERMTTDCLVVASFVIPEKADDTWAGAGRLLLSALIGYVLASPLIAGAQHMRTVARMTTTGKDISSVLRAIVKTERQHLPTRIVDSFNQYIALKPETRNSAVFNVNMAMSLWNNGLISAATETSDFDIRELRRQPMTIFIGCTIAELSIFRPLIRILFQQIHDLLMVKIPGDDAVAARRVLPCRAHGFADFENHDQRRLRIPHGDRDAGPRAARRALRQEHADHDSLGLVDQTVHPDQRPRHLRICFGNARRDGANLQDADPAAGAEHLRATRLGAALHAAAVRSSCARCHRASRS